ncbi:hypothetical protein K505DRAFT_98866 [Melanomma pulvis-pyrius CBS 109.77]|uniref:Uncharacterized protein n=1 Tax=Melanomma pulvis-pyrius CBS 109.77 TaxID=1314802 RepID=A0A6A6WXX2_9PLEO|nr:hypothetical protein K505DRAFT_98866 [Melanomma pulvis-pyrius CBS 109.77]
MRRFGCLAATASQTHVSTSTYLGSRSRPYSSPPRASTRPATEAILYWQYTGLQGMHTKILQANFAFRTTQKRSKLELILCSGRPLARTRMDILVSSVHLTHASYYLWCPSPV